MITKTNRSKRRFLVSIFLVVGLAIFGCGGGGDDDDGNGIDTAPPIDEPPAFEGLSTVSYSKDKGYINLSWDPAADDTTTQNDIVYQIFISVESGSEVYSTPDAITQPGATSYNVQGLEKNKIYYFVVLAQDEAGNLSEPIEYKYVPDGYFDLECLATDNEPPEFNGVASAIGIGFHAIELKWEQADDNCSDEDSIIYYIYSSEEGKEYNFDMPTRISHYGDESIVVSGSFDIDIDTDYCFIVRARDLAGNYDDNVVEACSRTAPDLVPPSFRGVQKADCIDDTNVRLSWEKQPAQDKVTFTYNITYLVYRGTVSGGEDLDNYIAETEKGAIFYDAEVTPETPYYFVVRAKDEAGNVDDNVREVKVTCSASK